MATMFNTFDSINIPYEEWKKKRGEKTKEEISPIIAHKIDVILEKRLDDYFNSHKLEIINDIIFTRTYSEEKSKILNAEFEKKIRQKLEGQIYPNKNRVTRVSVVDDSFEFFDD